MIRTTRERGQRDDNDEDDEEEGRSRRMMRERGGDEKTEDEKAEVEQRAHEHVPGGTGERIEVEDPTHGAGGYSRLISVATCAAPKPWKLVSETYSPSAESGVSKESMHSSLYTASYAEAKNFETHERPR